MKLICSLPTLLLLLLLLHPVNLWSEEGQKEKNTPQEDIVKDQTSDVEEQTAPDKETAKKSSPESEKSPSDEKEISTDNKKLDGSDESSDPLAPVASVMKQDSARVTSASVYWIDRVDQLVDARRNTEQSSFDNLYAELSVVFDLNSKLLAASLKENQTDSEVKQAVSERFDAGSHQLPETRKQLFDMLQTVYSQRLRLLSRTSAEVREDLTGADVEGVRELSRERTFLQLTVLYRIALLPRFTEHLLDNLRIAPLPTIVRSLEFIFAIIVFRYWRRWAPEGLKKLRQRLLQTTPASNGKRSLAKSLWYLDQVKGPVAWIILVTWVFGFIEDPLMAFFVEVAAITARWVLLSWLGVLFINALIEQRSRGLAGNDAKLSLRSLKYVGAWVVLSGLSLDLISRYTGEGTLYAWMLSLSEVMFFLLIALLVVLWKSSVYQRLADDPRKNPVVDAVLQHDKGLVAYLYTFVGVGYLFLVYLGRRLVDCMSYFSTGQQVLDSMLDLEIAKAYQQQKEAPDAEPVSGELAEKILRVPGEVIESAGGSVLEKLLERAEKGPGGTMVLIGESGLGKTDVLKRLDVATGKQSLFVSCPKEGLPGLLKELSGLLGIAGEEIPRRDIFEEMARQGIEVLLIDNIHMLIRPYVAGQDQLDRLAELFDSVPDLFCVVSCNTATWQYYLRVRAKRVLDKNVLTMRPWPIGQISRLIKNSCESVGITPDFSQVVVPRQFDDSNYDDPDQRSFYGFMRILHGASTGNPRLALGLWVKSLYVDSSGQIVVRLPRLTSTEELDNANLTMLLVLRVICRSEIVSYEDIMKSLQISDAEVTTALRLASHKGWVNKVDDGYYQLDWYWLKPIVRVLARQNLMSRHV